MANGNATVEQDGVGRSASLLPLPLLKVLIVGMLSARLSGAQSGPIPTASAIDAVRGFRTLAVDGPGSKELLVFCAVPQAFDADDNLVGDRRQESAPYTSQRACASLRVTDGALLPDAIYFETMSIKTDTTVLRARRKFGQALSTQEYVVTRVGLTSRYRVRMCILSSQVE